MNSVDTGLKGYEPDIHVEGFFLVKGALAFSPLIFRFGWASSQAYGWQFPIKAVSRRTARPGMEMFLANPGPVGVCRQNKPRTCHADTGDSHPGDPHARVCSRGAAGAVKCIWFAGALVVSAGGPAYRFFAGECGVVFRHRSGRGGPGSPCGLQKGFGRSLHAGT